MRSFHDSIQPNHSKNLLNSIPQSGPKVQEDFFGFLKNGEENQKKCQSFFSEKGLRQDIVHLTNAEPDICLEVFYALKNTLWPQIQEQSDFSLKDAWANFIGSSMIKGILCPPEKLIDKKMLKEGIKSENQIFKDLDQVVESARILKEKMADFDQEKEILVSLDLVQEFYVGFRNKVKELASDEALDDFLEPKAVMTGDIFTGHWAYRISRNKAQKLVSLGGTDPLVDFKVNGNPEREFMLSSLYRCLKIPVRESALLILTNIYEENPDNFFTVKASEAVIGEAALEVVKNRERDLDEEASSLQAIAAMLTNPSGDSFKNFKYSPIYKTLISIDNSLSFKPEFTGNDGKIVNIKSIFFLLPLMEKTVSKYIRTYFTTLDPNLIVLAWLQDLAKKNKEYEILSKRYRTRNSISLESDTDPFLPRIFVSKNLLNSIVDKLQKIERVLSNSPSASIQSLFEEISPILGRYYKRLRSTFNDPEVALKALSGQKQNNIDCSHLSALFNNEELNSLMNNQLTIPEDILDPEKLFDDYKNILASQTQTALDSLIRRHREKKRKNLLNLQDVLKELQLLIHENLTDSKSVRSIVDFMYEISTMIHQNDPHLVKEINALLSSLLHEELEWLLTVEKYFVRAAHDVPSEKRASSLTLHGAFMKQRILILTEVERKDLFDQIMNKKRILNHPYPVFDLKQYPERPGWEFASTLFMQLLGISQLPYQDLLIINQHPVLLTQKVNGNVVAQACENSQAFSNLDPYHTGLLIISAILISPEDGKEENFILSEDGKTLIPIVNDHNNTFEKNFLFCLDEMKKSTPLEVKKHILSIDFDELLASWLRELIKVDDRYTNLVDLKLQNQFLEQSTVLGILFPEQFIHDIYWKAHKIQYILRKEVEVTPLDLLKAVEASLAKSYLEAFGVGDTPRDRSKSMTMKRDRMSLLNTRERIQTSGGRISLPNMMMEINNISEQIGPVDALELLNELIKENNNLPEKEFDLLETDLENFFRNPKEVLVLKGSKLIKNDKLEALLQLRPDKGARIMSISFPKSPLLTSAAIRTLIEGCPNIESLDVSQCVKLDKIIIEEGEWPFLTRLEAQECPILEKFVCYSHHVQVLKLGSSCKIEIEMGEKYSDYVSITMKTQFTLDFKKGGGFEIISANKKLSNQEDFIRFGETMFDSYFKDLKIKIGENQISSGKNLGVLIQSIDLTATQDFTTEGAKRIAGLINLERLNLSECVFLERGILSCLLQGHWPKLKYLNLSMIELENDNFSRLSLGKWPQLEQLHLQRTNLRPAEIESIVTRSNWSQLKHLNLSFNEIYDEGLLILSRENWSPPLETLDLSLTRVTTKGLLKFLLNTKWSNLKQINFAPWEVANKNLVDNWFSLEEVNLSRCGLTAIELRAIVSQRKWPQLKYLNLSCNEISEEGFSFLSLGEWPLLEELHLEDTKLTSAGIETIVDKSKWPRLKHLDISNNDGISDESIKLLARGNWPQLEALNLSLIKATRKGLINFFLNIVNWARFKQVIFLPEEMTNQEIADQFLPSNWGLVEKVDLRDVVGITGEEMKVIVEKSNWPKLKHLDISNNDDISDDTIEVLSRGNWPLLEVLDLRRTKVTARGFLNLVLDIDWPNLKEIVFALSDNLSKSLANSLLPINWGSLQRLDLRNIGMRQSDIIKIVNKSKWTQLKQLVLSDNDIFDEGLRTLCQGKWPLLETIDLSRTKVTMKGLLLNFLVNGNWANLKGIAIEDFNRNDSCLISSLLPTHWPELKKLDLTGLKITQEDISVIVKKAIWPRLKYLNLSNNDVGDKGLEVLSGGKWPLLEKLYLGDVNISLEGFEVMLKNSNCPDLKELHLCNELLRDPVVSKLVSEKWPHVVGLFPK